MDGGLGVDDEPAHQRGQRDQQKAQTLVHDDAAQHIAQRGEAHVDAGQEQHQPNVCIAHTDEDAQQRQLPQVQREDLEQQEEHADGQQGYRHLTHHAGQLLQIAVAHGEGGLEAVHYRLAGGSCVFRIQEAQQQHRQNGADGAQRHQTEAVGLGLFVASDGGDTNAQRHDEGYRHGAGGDAAGVKGHRQEVRVGQGGQNEHNGIEHQQQRPQGDAQQDTQHADGQENAHAYRHRQDQHGLVDARYVLGQHLQVRLSNGDDHAQNESQHQNEPQAAGLGHFRAYQIAHLGHGQLRTQREQAHANDQQHRAHQKGQHQAAAYGEKEKAQHRHDNGDGQYGIHRLFQFTVDDFTTGQSNAPFLEFDSGAPLSGAPRIYLISVYNKTPIQAS